MSTSIERKHRRLRVLQSVLCGSTGQVSAGDTRPHQIQTHLFWCHQTKECASFIAHLYATFSCSLAKFNLTIMSCFVS